MCFALGRDARVAGLGIDPVVVAVVCVLGLSVLVLCSIRRLRIVAGVLVLVI